MENKSYLSVIAFMDDDADYASDQYLYEFCKIVLYQHGYEAMNIMDLRNAVMELVPLEYTEEDIVRVLKNTKYKDVVFENETYSLSSECNSELQKRDRSFPLRKIIDDYCDKFIEPEKKRDKNELCELITRFLFSKFKESFEQIFSILESNSPLATVEMDDYSDEDKDFINGFLSWDNAAKNEIVYKLIVKSYDFCMINCPKEISFDFTDFKFYLDANIVMRLLGINNRQRREAMTRFVDKCKQSGIHLIVSCYTKKEIENSIKAQLSAIEEEINRMGRLQSPQMVEFGHSERFSLDLYRKFYQYSRDTKSLSLNGFKNALFKELSELLNDFEYVDSISFEAKDSNQYEMLSDSLRKFKDESVIKTDVNNVLLLLEQRKKHKDSYMISADNKLINWCKQIFVDANSLAEYPSVWLSIIMKYTGRATEDDYSAFCKFIRLPIISKEKDIKKKAELRLHVEQLNVSEQMKDRIVDELRNEYNYYSEFNTPDEAINKAYETLQKQHDDEIRHEVSSYYEKEMQSIKYDHVNEVKRLNDEKTNQQEHYKSIISDVKVAAEKDSLSASVSEWIDEKVNASLAKTNIVKTNEKTIKFVFGTIIICIVVILRIFVIKKNLSWYDSFTAIATIIFEYVGINGVDAYIEWFSNEERLRKKYTRKSQKKFKDLLRNKEKNE